MTHLINSNELVGNEPGEQSKQLNGNCGRRTLRPCLAVLGCRCRIGKQIAQGSCARVWNNKSIKLPRSSKPSCVAFGRECTTASTSNWSPAQKRRCQN